MVFALEFTMPAWTALLAVWFLRERMTPSRLGVVVFGLIGVLVILRPGIADFNPAVILVLLAAFGYAITMIATKKLTMTETTFGIVFWMAVIQFPLSLIGSDPAAVLHFDARHILPAIGVGTAGLTSHYCLSNAFRSGDATLVVPLDFMRIPLIAVVGWAFYGEQLDIFVLLGAVIIVSGCSGTCVLKSHEHTDNKARPIMIFRLECARMRVLPQVCSRGRRHCQSLATAHAQSSIRHVSGLSSTRGLDRGNADPARAEQIRRTEDTVNRQQFEVDRCGAVTAYRVRKFRVLLDIQQSAAAMRRADPADRSAAQRGCAYAE
jgi:uncharacterized membrane protein